MEEVPGSEESLLALDEQPAVTGQNEKGLLIRLGVVNAALAGLEDGHIDPKLRELDRRLAVLIGEPTPRAPRLRREPFGIAHVDDKPTLRDGGKPGASILKHRFVHAADSRSPSVGLSRLGQRAGMSPEHQATVLLSLRHVVIMNGMNKPRIFLGSSGKQAKLLQAIARGLKDIADVEPWTTTFNPGRSTLDRLVELSQEVDFAAFVFAQDDWTTTDAAQSGQASPRDNVVFEAGLFGGVLGMRRTFILHASGSKLPSDLLGLTCVRYGGTTPSEMRAVNEKLRKAIENEGRAARIEGLWWQFSL